MHRALFVICGLLSISPAWGLDILSGFGVRIKDIALVEGARPNQLSGIGIVNGLNRTGDSGGANSVATEMMKNILRANNLIPDAEIENLDESNAAVMVYAEIPPFAKPGTKIDVHVAAIGGAESLQGGILLQTPLKGADGHVYAVAQGALATGTFEFGGRGARVQRGGTSGTVATVPSGAIVEEEIPVTMLRNQYIYLSLKNADFTTAVRMADAINAGTLFKDSLIKMPAAPVDAATVRVEIPENYQDQVDLVRVIQRIESMVVEPDRVARIVVNERTGTIVVGEHVRISTVAVSHGGLSVSIAETPEVFQPNPFAETGQTETVDRTAVGVEEGAGVSTVIQGGITVAELANALNSLGATTRDVIAILQAIKREGALQAELIIM